MKHNYESTHLMVDIETLSTRTNAVVLSLGATLFVPNKILESRYWTFDLSQQKERHIDPETIKWWLTQKPEILATALSHPTDTYTVLDQLGSWLLTHNTKFLWAHSPHFDLMILDDLFRNWGGLPIGFRGWLDTRTLSYFTSSPVLKAEKAHNAMEDAIAQAEWVSKLI